MKKILVFVLCILLIGAMSVVASAEGVEEDTEVEVSTPVVETDVETEVEPEKTMTETIKEYITTHFEEISVIATLVAAIFYEVRKHRSLNGSIGTLNNNAIKVAENSATAITNVLAEAKDIAGVVATYRDEFATLIAEIRQSAEEKKSLEESLKSVEAFLKTAKLATLELSNEVAELLVLANIPTSKKEELYGRHLKAVKAIEQVEGAISNDGEET